MSYNYFKDVKNDVRKAINDYDFSEFETIEEFEEWLNDTLWFSDSVTGNGSGSHTFNRRKAQEYVMDNFDLMHDAAKKFDSVEKMMRWLWDEEYEFIDVFIRCYLLSDCISEVIEEIEPEFERAHKNDEEKG